MFKVHPVCSCLYFSPSNLSAAFFGSTTFELLLVLFRHLSLSPVFCTVCRPIVTDHPFHIELFSNSSIFPNCIQSHGSFLGRPILVLVSSEQLPVFFST